MATVEGSAIGETVVRRALRDGDVVALAELHRQVYGAEYGLNEEFVGAVHRGVQAAVATGWPQRSGAVWLVERGGPLLGGLALTDEREGVGKLRWFVLDPSLRGHGLGRSLVAQLLDEARAAGLHTLRLETVSLLTVAARIYRRAGFEVVWERERTDWGPPLTYQGYELKLSRAG
jgi:ribosomal protein S18 acetylase RimI-like enzyme